MDGISGYIAGISMQMSAQSLQNQVELYTIGKAMDLQSSQAAQMLGSFAEVNQAPPVDGLGALLDVSA